MEGVLRKSYYILARHITEGNRALPMIYVSEKTMHLLEELTEHLRENANTPGRILKTDVIHAALGEYAKRLGLREK